MASRLTPRRAGRPSSAENMNILSCEIEDVAEAIKLRLIRRGGEWEVTVDSGGSVRMDNNADPLRSHPLPASWLIGTYTRRARCSDIKDDLGVRLRELQLERAA